MKNYKDLGFNSFVEKRTPTSPADIGGALTGTELMNSVYSASAFAAAIPPNMISGDKIDSLAVEKLVTGTISSKQITLAVEEGQGDVYIAAGKSDFTNTDAGFILGIDDSDSNTAKFYIGNASEYLNWDGSNLTISGNISATSIHIPDEDTTANSFHVESDGDMFLGCTQSDFTADNDNANAYILKTGVAKFQAVTLAGNVTISDLQAGSDLDGQYLTANSVTATQIAANTITASEISAGAITTTEIAATTIVAGNIAADTITANEIASATITGTEISSLSISGKTITADTGTVGGWTLAAGALSSGSVTINASSEVILMGLATNPTTGLGVFLGKDGSDYEFRAGDPAGARVHYDGTTLTVNGATLTALATGSEIGIQGWVFDGGFSVTDADTVAWGSGTLTLLNGATYSIDAGNTGNMAAETYVYLDIAVSSTVLQTTTTKATAMGSGKILIAVCENGTGEATFIEFGSGAMNIPGSNIQAASITASEITANTITANEIAANTITATEIQASSITATEMNVSQLSAIAADLGSITSGTVTGGTIQTASSGSRVVMDTTSLRGINSAGATVFEFNISSGDAIIGDDATNTYIQWDNSESELIIKGLVQGGPSTIPFNVETFDDDASANDIYTGGMGSAGGWVGINMNASGDIIAWYSVKSGIEAFMRIGFENGQFYKFAGYGESGLLASGAKYETNDKMDVMDFNGKLFSIVWDDSAGTEELAYYQTFGSGPTSIAFDSTLAAGRCAGDDTTIYIPDHAGLTRVYKFTMNGTPKLVVDPSTPYVDFDSAATDGFHYDGTDFWTRIGGVIKRHNSSGVTQQTITMTNTPSNLCDGVFVQDGIVYVASFIGTWLGSNVKSRPLSITIYPVGLSDA